MHTDQPTADFQLNIYSVRIATQRGHKAQSWITSGQDRNCTTKSNGTMWWKHETESLQCRAACGSLRAYVSVWV